MRKHRLLFGDTTKDVISLINILARLMIRLSVLRNRSSVVMISRVQQAARRICFQINANTLDLLETVIVIILIILLQRLLKSLEDKSVTIRGVGIQIQLRNKLTSHSVLSALRVNVIMILMEFLNLLLSSSMVIGMSAKKETNILKSMANILLIAPNSSSFAKHNLPVLIRALLEVFALQENVIVQKDSKEKVVLLLTEKNT